MRTIPPKGRKRKKGNWFQHDFAFMRKVVNDYITGTQSKAEVAKRYGISYSKVSDWVRRYQKGIEPFDEVSLPPMPIEEQQADQTETEKQNLELLKKLEQANLKITGLEIMIDIAEEQLGIDIRKKSGAKQPEE